MVSTRTDEIPRLVRFTPLPEMTFPPMVLPADCSRLMPSSPFRAAVPSEFVPIRLSSSHLSPPVEEDPLVVDRRSGCLRRCRTTDRVE